MCLERSGRILCVLTLPSCSEIFALLLDFLALVLAARCVLSQGVYVYVYLGVYVYVYVY